MLVQMDSGDGRYSCAARVALSKALMSYSWNSHHASPVQYIERVQPIGSLVFFLLLISFFRLLVSPITRHPPMQ